MKYSKDQLVIKISGHEQAATIMGHESDELHSLFDDVEAGLQAEYNRLPKEEGYPVMRPVEL